jgi:hypothetical protein
MKNIEKIRNDLNMIGVVFNIQNPLNFDIGFPYTEDFSKHRTLRNAVSEKTGVYREYDKIANAYGETKELPLFKVRLGGIIRKKKDVKKTTDEGIVKYNIIQKNNRAGGVFFITITSIDKYGRLEANIIDPVTGESLSEWLIKEYPHLYRPYVQRV